MAVPILAIAGIAMSVGGNLAAAEAKKRAGNAAAAMHRTQGRQTQRRFEQQAVDVMREADVLGRRRRHEGRTDVGRYRTAYASSGVEVGTGTAHHVQLRGEQIAAAEVIALRANGKRQAIELRTQGREEKDLANMKAKYAKESGDAGAMESYFAAGSSLLSGLNKAGFLDKKEEGT